MSQQPLKIGEILVKEGYLTLNVLERVLEAQSEQEYISKSKKDYRPFGQICIDMGLISASELQRILKKHNKRIRLGELLVNKKVITIEALNKALEVQNSGVKKRLGEILIEQGSLNQNQLLDALSVQLDVSRMLPSMELIDEALLDQMPLDFYKKNLCLPMYKSGRELTVVMAYPDQDAVIQSFEQNYRLKVMAAIAPLEAIIETLAEYEKLKKLPGLQPLSAEHVPDRVQTQPAQGAVYSESPEVAAKKAARKQEDQVVSFLFKNATQERATTIHIEPQEKHIRIRYRVDGVLQHKTDLPTHLGPAMTKRLKELSKLDSTECTVHQKGSFSGTFNERNLEVDLATYPSLWGETMVLSLQEKNSSTQERLLNLDRIGFSPLYYQRFKDVLNTPGGIIVVTGPTDSGKSTTLYAAINYLNQQNRSIITAENPIEMHVPGTVQGAYTQGEKFADRVATMMHLDPDILMVSEIDSAETMETVSEIALSGAKILTSYPAFDATGALLRLSRMGLENYLLAASNITVLSQRLLRKLCDNCKVEHVPEQKVFDQLGLVEVVPDAHVHYKPVGCEQCQQRGFVDQVAIHELLTINEAIREAVLEGKPAATIRGIARTEAKLISMAEDGYYKAAEGITSIDEVQRVAFVNEYDSQTPWEADEISTICKGLEPDFL